MPPRAERFAATRQLASSRRGTSPVSRGTVAPCSECSTRHARRAYQLRRNAPARAVAGLLAFPEMRRSELASFATCQLRAPRLPLLSSAACLLVSSALSAWHVQRIGSDRSALASKAARRASSAGSARQLGARRSAGSDRSADRRGRGVRSWLGLLRVVRTRRAPNTKFAMSRDTKFPRRHEA